MIYPLRENMEVFTGPEGSSIRCTRCRHVFCRADEDWKRTARVHIEAPTKAGPLMNELSGKYVLQQKICPSCGILLDTDLVQEEKEEKQPEAKEPKQPDPQPVTVRPQTTAILVLDLSARCEDPRQPCSALLPTVGSFLEKARAAAVPIVFSISASARGTPLDRVASPLNRRDGEPVIYPDGFDKFVGGALQRILEENGIKTLVIVGSATNVAVMYTATTAARIHRYEVVIPVDGVTARTQYAHEYGLYQLTVLPGGVNRRVQLTVFPMLSLS